MKRLISNPDVYYSTEGNSYVARLDAQVRAVTGERMSSYFRKRHVQLFDKGTTANLLTLNGSGR